MADGALELVGMRDPWNLQSGIEIWDPELAPWRDWVSEVRKMIVVASGWTSRREYAIE